MRLIVGIVQLAGGVIQALLFFRFLFLLFGVRPDNQVGSFVFDTTAPIAQLFDFIPAWDLGRYVVDFSVLVAMLVVAVLWYLLIHFLTIIASSLTRPRHDEL